ncbi:MAG: tRNA-dihydrouridine synthase family protein [Muribaculaceae bacterium]|nr:tRNA-dihydrouridine synthase family protein [Muribaculaceae bacterium]
MNVKSLLIAPLQGLTDPAWRCAHARAMHSSDMSFTYFSPFVRVESDEIRARDIKSLAPDRNRDISLVPQVIFKDMNELGILTEAITRAGYSRIDLNMGCPFPPQVKAGRGVAAAVNPCLLAELADFVSQNPDLEFSVKMRPGISSPDEWEKTIELINKIPVKFVTLHPRVAKAGYRGKPDLECFDRFSERLHHPLIYNGDITTPSDYAVITDRFPNIKGVMLGRGMLSRPSLGAEIIGGNEWDADRRRELWLAIHRAVAESIIASSQGDAQALARLKPRLEFIESDLFDKRYLKALVKSRDLATYLSLLNI